jgi:hypothetical protein
MSATAEIKRITTNTLQKMKASGRKIAMLTAYDYSFARLFDEAGIDVILVGDSASNVMAGHETTLPITLDQMIYHAASVIRGAKRSLVVVGSSVRLVPIQQRYCPGFCCTHDEGNRCAWHKAGRWRRSSRIL